MGSDQLDELLAEVLALEQAQEGLGRAARPWATLSRGRSLPLPTSWPSSLSASGQTSMCSLTMKPSIFMRLTRMSAGLAMGRGAPS
jgi:hypothetical protein